MSNSTLQIRIDSKTKREAKKTLEELGLDISSGVKIFLKQVIKTKGIPFTIRTANGFTPEQEREMIQEAEEAVKYGKRFNNIKELHDDLFDKANKNKGRK